MMKYLFLILGLITLITAAIPVKGQLANHEQGRAHQHFANSVSREAKAATMNVSRRYREELKHWERVEKRLARKYSKKGKVQTNLHSIDSLYRQLNIQLDQAGGSLPNVPYVPGRDSLQTALKYLMNSKGPAGSADVSEIQEALHSIEGLEQGIGRGHQIENVLTERRKMWQETVGNLKPVKQLESLKKRSYYLHQTVKEYEQVLAHPEGVQQKALQLLRKVPAFNEFMAKNSVLASLFPVPEAIGTPAALAGLQTRVDVGQEVSRFAASGGPDGAAMLQQQVQTAKKSMDMLKDKINKAGGGNSDFEQPDFKPNNQRTKTFLKRIEIGTNLQTGKQTSFVPTTSDMGLSLGYRLSDHALVGVGGAYKLGWRGNLRSLSFSHQGVGLRSFFDYQLKKSFWLSCGAEMNYQSEFTRVAELRDFNAWQQSGLLGITKKYSISKKFKGNAQFLWDVLSYRQVPRTQPVVFRLGYSLK